MPPGYVGVAQLETMNLADWHPDRVQTMAEQYQEWADRCQVLAWKTVLGKRPRDLR